MKRRFFTLCSAVSLLLCVGVAVLSIVRAEAIDGAWCNVGSRQFVGVQIAGRRAALTWGSDSTANPKWFGRMNSPAEDALTMYWADYGRWHVRIDAAPFGGYREWVSVPLWAIGVLLGGATLCFRWLSRAGTRLEVGRCPACGYDLRATPAKCPECGAVPEPDKMPA